MVSSNKPSVSVSQNVQDVIRRAQEMVSHGDQSSTHDVAKLIGEIGRLPDAERKELFATFETVKQQSGAPKNREAVEVFLGALRDKPAQLLSKLEKDDGVIDLKDAMHALAELGQGARITGKERVSVFTMLLISKTTPEARDALTNFSEGRAIDIDHVMRGLLARGNITPEEVRALKVGAGTDPYGCYQLSYWAQTTKPANFAPGAQTELHAAAEETFHHVGRHYREDLELNRGRSPSPLGARTLDLFSRETLQLPYPVTFGATPPGYHLDVAGTKKVFARPDDLAAFLIETALKLGGHDIESVRWDPADGGRYVLSKRNVETRATFHSEILREFGYPV